MTKTGLAGRTADAAGEDDGYRSVGNWYVYILACRDGSLYTGIARDPQKRFRQHQAGRGARFTRAHPPLEILGTLVCGDRSVASRLEYRIKRLSRKEKLALAALWAERRTSA